MLFDPFESIVLFLSVLTVNYVVQDGRSNWLEGMILICLFVLDLCFLILLGTDVRYFRTQVYNHRVGVLVLPGNGTRRAPDLQRLNGLSGPLVRPHALSMLNLLALSFSSALSLRNTPQRLVIILGGPPRLEIFIPNYITALTLTAISLD